MPAEPRGKKTEPWRTYWGSENTELGVQGRKQDRIHTLVNRKKSGEQEALTQELSSRKWMICSVIS